MFEEINSFDESYGEAKKWMKSEQARLIARAQKGDLDDLELEVAVYTDELSKRLIEPGRVLMATEAWRQASFKEWMGFTRFRMTQAAPDGYASVSLVQRAISLQKNKRAGVIELPKALKMDAQRTEASIGMVAEKLTGDPDFQGAIDSYANSQESIIKHSQIETIIASQKDERNTKIEAMRIVGDGDTCKYCRGLAGYWTPQLYTLRHFHNGCKCKIVTRFI